VNEVVGKCGLCAIRRDAEYVLHFASRLIDSYCLYNHITVYHLVNYQAPYWYVWFKNRIYHFGSGMPYNLW